MTTLIKAGRYEITGELGRGAMGVVFKATDPVIGRAVAVKTIRLSEEGTGLSRSELSTRFQTEARAAGLLTHPNIVVIYDAGEEDGLFYITMELVEGRSLQALLDARQSFALPRVLRIMEQACSALQFAHERNVVHRDIKPANLMLTADDTVKVTDFGTAKILQFGTMQQTAHVMGTPSYMSPEQVKGRAVDGRSDIFALGVVLYEMVAGEKPFPGQNITTVIYKIVNEEPVPPRQIDPTIHPGISYVILKALAKDPAQRYQNCREMLEDLRNYRSLGGGEAGPNATTIAGAPNATLPLGANSGWNAQRDDTRTAGTAHAHSARAAGPAQTPSVRRTGSMPPMSPPKKRSAFGSAVAALFLLGVIAYGAYKIRPFYQSVREGPAAAGNATPATNDSRAPAKDPAPPVVSSGSADLFPEQAATQPPAAEIARPETPVPVPASAKVDAKPPSAEAEKPAVAKAPAEKPAVRPPDPSFAAAEAFKNKIDQAAAQHGLSDRLRVESAGNTLSLSGNLRPIEYRAVLKFLRSAPASVRFIDHIVVEPERQVEQAAATPAPSPELAVQRPLFNRFLGAIHVESDVTGATAVLLGPRGRVVSQCTTPCSFGELFPAQYSLEVKKDGYQPVQTAMQVRAGRMIDQRIALESLANGLFVTSTPPGASVYINGAQQSGQTPVNLPLAAGSYDLMLRLDGYDGVSERVQVKDNAQTTIHLDLKQRDSARIAWAEVQSAPAGAAILVDGVDTGKVTPSRVQIAAGMRTITLRLAGYAASKRTVQVSEGGTVSVQDTLRRQ